MVKRGVVTGEAMKKHIHSHVVDVLFHGKDVPHKSNQRFWPNMKAIRSNIKRQLKKQQRSMIDQECLLHKIEDWKREDPSVKIFYRQKNNESEREDTEEEEMKEDDDEEEEEEDEDDMEEDEDDVEDDADEDSDTDDEEASGERVRVKAKLNNSLLFVYQTEEMSRLLRRYGNDDLFIFPSLALHNFF